MENYLALLKEFLSFKSVSTDSQFKDEVKKTAEWLNTLFADNGFETKLVEGYGNPIVLSSFNKIDRAPTALLYGHYDVQPASQEEGWSSDPFSVTEKDGRLVARGSVDNKGQVLIHIASILELIKSGNLKYNIKFIIEGNEETGSPDLVKFIEDYKKELTSDFVIFSDGQLTMGHPVIDIGYRGIFNTTLTVKTSDKDNHSGLYGGSIPNAATELIRIISKLHDVNGVLQLEGLDNTIEKLDKAIVDDNMKVPFENSEFLSNTGAKTKLNKDINFYLQTGYLTSAEVTGFKAGYTEEGYRNAIPGKAMAKINFRISPLHSAEDVKKKFEDFVKQHAPDYIEYNFDVSEINEPIDIDINNQYMSAVKTLLEKVYNTEAYFKACGAIVPVAGLFKDVLNVPVVSVGLGNEDCNMHGANENFTIDLVKKGLEFSKTFFSK